MSTSSFLTQIRFDAPRYAMLLLVLPFVAMLAYRSMGGLGGVRCAVALTLRCLVVVLLIAALAGPSVVRRVTDQVVVFALDLSESIPRIQREAAMAFLRAASDGARPGRDRVAVVSFGDDAQVEQLPRAALEIERVAGPGCRSGTNIGNAMQLSQALFLPNFARRIVVLSDGNENAGSALPFIDAAAAAGIPVDVVPLRYAVEQDVLVESVVAPATARLEETVAVNVTLRATNATAGQLLLYYNDVLVDLYSAGDGLAMPVQLEAGANRVAVPVPLRSVAHRFRAVFQPSSPADDGRSQNNEGRAFTLVAGPQRVLLLADLGREPSHADQVSAELLAGALRRQRVECDVADANAFGLSPESLSAYAAVILSNVSAASLGLEGERVLAASVREFGLGLVMVGGDQSFTVGGYHGSPIGDILPVETCKQKLQLPTLGQVFVLDRSGSMSGLKLELAKHAARDAVKLLDRRDSVGVVAFDSGVDWVVPFQRYERPSAVENAIGQIGWGGGTDMQPALSEAIDALAGSDVALRHIVLLTDGRTAPGNFEGVATRMAELKITCSSVGIGDDVDRALLTMLTTRTGGRPYFVNDPQSVPQIFARETVLAGRAALYERPFVPQLAAAGSDAILAGFRQAEFPALEGCVITAARPLATVALVRPTEEGSDPILAYWQVGVGRAAAFTGGMWPRWGAEWSNWPGFGRFWAPTLRWVARPAVSDAFEVSSRVEGGRVTVVLHSRDPRLENSGPLTWAGRVLDPEFRAREIPVSQTGPGRYEASFETDEAASAGSYFLNLAFVGDAGLGGAVRTGVSIPYSREFRDMRANEPLLAEIARRTGGRSLSDRQSAEVFEAASIRPVEAVQPAWDLLVRWALALFLLDVAVRRLALNPRAAAARLRARISEATGAAPVAAAATLGTLRDVRAATQRERTGSRMGRSVRRTLRAERGDTARPTAPSVQAPAADEKAKQPGDGDDAAAADVDPLQRLRAARDRARGQQPPADGTA